MSTPAGDGSRSNAPSAAGAPTALKPQRTRDLCEDRPWLDGFRAGDAAALERVFRAYAPLVFQVIRQGARLADGSRVYLADASAEDDVAQECFIRLLTPPARARYDGLRPYGALVRTVARNTLIDHLRKRGRISGHEVQAEDLQDNASAAAEVSGPPSPDAVLLSAEDARAADALLASLSDDERRLAQVRFQQGLSQRDAAEALGVSRQNLRTLEAKLVDKARAFLRRRGW